MQQAIIPSVLSEDIATYKDAIILALLNMEAKHPGSLQNIATALTFLGYALAALAIYFIQRKFVPLQ